MRKYGWLLALVVALLTAPAHAAIVWNVVQNDDCTAVNAATGITGAAVPCCTQADWGFCNRKSVSGDLLVRFVTFGSLTSQTYTTGGDAISASNMERIGLTQIVHADCSTTLAGGFHVVLDRQTSGGPKVRLLYYDFNNAADGPAIQVPNATATDNEAFTCTLYGY